MSNRSFHQVAYKANERRELLSAINEFLDDSIVLPPGDWERQALLPFDELKAKSEHIRRRKAKAIEEKKKQQQPTQTQSEAAAAKKGLCMYTCSYIGVTCARGQVRTRRAFRSISARSKERELLSHCNAQFAKLIEKLSEFIKESLGAYHLAALNIRSINIAIGTRVVFLFFF